MLNMFEQRYSELEETFAKSVEVDNEMTLEEFHRYELISIWEKRIFENEEKLLELGMI